MPCTMAANKVATMLHRNTNRMTLILIYAVLEWILIILLLLNSLFSYLIIKFADYFGLKTPCLWCSRVDCVFEPGKKKNSHRDLLCEVHSTEISKLGYCSNHRKLAESQDMCEKCSSSRPEYLRASKNLAFFPWVKEIGMIQSEGEKVTENGEVGFKCSCCGVSLESKFYSPYIVIKPSLGVLDCTQKGNLITEARNRNYEQLEGNKNSDRCRSGFVMDRCQDGHGIEENNENQMLSNEGCGVREHDAEVDCSVSVSDSGLRELEADEDEKVGVFFEVELPVKEDNSKLILEETSSGETRQDGSIEILSQHLEFFVGQDGYGLIPVELIDSTTEENQGKYRIKEEDDGNCDNHEANLGSESRDGTRVEPVVENRSTLGEKEAGLSAHEIKEKAKFAVPESMEIEENENSLIFHSKECDFLGEVHKHIEPQTTSKDVYDCQETLAAEAEERDSDILAVTEETFQMPINEAEAEVSIGTEIADLEPTDELQNKEILPPYTYINEDPSTSSANSCAEDNHGSEQDEEDSVELTTISVEVREHMNQTSLGSVNNETEEEKVPDTPTSIESLHHLHKKLLLLEKKELGTEESLDGSVMSEFEGVGIISIEQVISVLRVERKALHALYGELEEERSASAVAVNQTMAMINRLQEEKAAMQMEALQYQRMMEEQSEYDQEVLQLLSEHTVKREKEKQELERELEVYRKKVLEYQAKEKMRILRRSMDGSTRSESSFASSSNASDGLFIDLNQETNEEDGFDQENGNHNTPVDAVLNLKESLANFEEERLSILEQLKVLEEKLFTLADEDEQHFDDIKPIEHFYKENGKHFDGYSDLEGNGVGNDFPKEMNGKHNQEGRIRGAKGKILLPLFDAISEETVLENGHVNGFHSDTIQTSAAKRIALENKFVIEEEVDHLYDRLQALEADREFLKHCISSLKKGDKGMNLLQEILQHLHDLTHLRNVELRVRNFSDNSVA